MLGQHRELLFAFPSPAEQELCSAAPPPRGRVRCEELYRCAASSWHPSGGFGTGVKIEQGCVTAIINGFKRHRFLERDKRSWKKQNRWGSLLLLQLAVL